MLLTVYDKDYLTLMKINFKNPSLLVSLGIVIVIVVSAYAYETASTATIASLHDRYDAYIEAKVVVSSASTTTMATGVNSEAWSSNPLAVDFGTCEASKITAPVPVKITNMMLIDDTRIHVRTDCSQPGIHVYVSETVAAFDILRVDLTRSQSLKGVTFNLATGRGKTSTPGFAVMVDPSVPAGEYTFHIFVSYSYCND